MALSCSGFSLYFCSILGFSDSVVLLRRQIDDWILSRGKVSSPKFLGMQVSKVVITMVFSKPLRYMILLYALGTLLNSKGHLGAGRYKNSASGFFESRPTLRLFSEKLIFSAIQRV